MVPLADPVPHRWLLLPADAGRGIRAPSDSASPPSAAEPPLCLLEREPARGETAC